MTSPDLHSLLDRVREATGPSRELDAAIAIAIDGAEALRYPQGHPPGVIVRNGKIAFASPVSSYLDAVVALIEEKLPGWQRASGTCGEQDMPWACLTEPDEPCRDFTADAPDEVLALLAALLQALIEVQNHDEA